MPDAAELIRQLKSRYPNDYGSLSDQDLLGKLHKANPTKYSAYTLAPPPEKPSEIPILTPAYHGAKKMLGNVMSGAALGAAALGSSFEDTPELASKKRIQLLEESPIISDIYKAGKNVATTPELKPYESGTAQFLLRDIPELVGNMAPALFMGPVGAGAMFATQGAATEYERSLAEKRPESQAIQDAAWGTVTNALSAIPFTKAGTVAAKGIATGIQKIAPGLGAKSIPYLGKAIATSAEMSGINMAQYAAQQALTGREVNIEEMKDVGKMGLVGAVIGPMHLKMQRMGLKKAITANEAIINDPATKYDQKLSAYKNNEKLNKALWDTRVGQDQTESKPPQLETISEPIPEIKVEQESLPKMDAAAEPLPEDVPFFKKQALEGSDIPALPTNKDTIQEHIRREYPKSHKGIEILTSEEAIKKYGRDDAFNEQIKESVGFFLPKRGKIGNIVIVSDNINNWHQYQKNNGEGNYGNWRELVDEAVKHELTHMGMKQAFETARIPFDDSMQKIYHLALSDNEFMPSSYKKLANSDPMIFVEEWMNFKFGSDPKSPLLQRAVSYIRTVLRQYFPKMEWSDNDIRYMVQKAQNKAQQMTSEYPGGGSADLPKFMSKDQNFNDTSRPKISEIKGLYTSFLNKGYEPKKIAKIIEGKLNGIKVEVAYEGEENVFDTGNGIFIDKFGDKVRAKINHGFYGDWEEGKTSEVPDVPTEDEFLLQKEHYDRIRHEKEVASRVALKDKEIEKEFEKYRNENLAKKNVKNGPVPKIEIDHKNFSVYGVKDKFNSLIKDGYKPESIIDEFRNTFPNWDVLDRKSHINLDSDNNAIRFDYDKKKDYLKVEAKINGLHYGDNFGDISKNDIPDIRFMSKDQIGRSPEEQAKHDLLAENIDRRFVGLPEAKQEMLDYIQGAGKDLVEDTLRILHDEDIQAAATHLDVDAIIKGHKSSSGIGHAEMVALESEFVKLSKMVQDSTPENKAKNTERMNKIASILCTTIPARSEAARLLRGQRLKVQDMLVEIVNGNKPDAFQRSSYDMLNRTVDILSKRTNRPKEQIYNELLNIPNKFDRFNYIKKMMRSNKIEHGKDIFKWYIYNNILSGLNAHLRNTASTSLHIGQGIAARPYTVLLNKLAGADLATKEELGAAGIKNTLKGLWTGTKEGAKQASEIWQWGISESQIDYLGIPTEPFEGKALNAISRALTAEDAVMRNATFGEHLYTWAFNDAVKAKVNIHDGKALAAHMQKAIENIPKDIKEQLYHQSDRDVFRSEPGEIGQKIEALRNAIGVPGTMIMPFFRTVSNVTKAVLENTFLGFAFKDQRAVTKAIYNHLFKGIKAGDTITREQLDAMARTILGVTGISVIGAMYRAGEIDMTGPIPSDPEEARLFWAENKQPNSILIPGKGWVEYQYLGSLGPALSMAKSFIDNWTRDNSDKPEKYVLPLIDTMRNISDTGFLSGLANLQQLIGNPKQTISKYGAAQMGMITPLSGAQRYMANKDFFGDIPEIGQWTGDPIMRDANTMAERYVESTPMVWPLKHPETIPPMLDVSGKFLTRSDTTDFGFTKIKPENKDFVATELVRLKKAGEEKIPISAFQPSGKIPEKMRPAFGGREDWNPEERFALSYAITNGLHDEFNRVMSLPQYQSLTDEQKGDVIRKVKSRTTDSIRKAVIPQMLQRFRELEPIPTSARTQ